MCRGAVFAAIAALWGSSARAQLPPPVLPIEVPAPNWDDFLKPLQPIDLPPIDLLPTPVLPPVPTLPEPVRPIVRPVPSAEPAGPIVGVTYFWIPRQTKVGQTWSAEATVKNRLPHSVRVRVTISVPGYVKFDNDVAAKVYTLPAYGSKNVSWDLRTVSAGSGTFYVKVDPVRD
jgi:hypothetical protein